jgi:hypothetical protein
VADLLNIPKDHIYANRLLFNEGGEHAGFDPNEYTARSGGKAKAVEEIKKVSENGHPKQWVSPFKHLWEWGLLDYFCLTVGGGKWVEAMWPHQNAGSHLCLRDRDLRSARLRVLPYGI